MNKYYRIFGKVVFPEGLAAGEGRGSNVIDIARNGEGKPVLRGTSIAGALRSALAEWGVPQKSISYWFGEKLEGKNDFNASQILVADVVLDSGRQQPESRTFNMLNRHTGAVLDNALFSIESLPPKTSGNLLIYVIPRDAQPAENILRAIENVFDSSLILGGNRNRGIGRMDASGVKCIALDCSTVDGFSKWQDIRYADRAGTPVDLTGCEEVAFGDPSVLPVKNYEVEFKIPRGEDISIGFGKNLDGDLCAQQYAYSANGNKLWRIPGSTFRGAFRSWMTHLAVLENQNVLYQEKNPKADLIGWAGKEGDERKKAQENPALLNDPILDLFGSLYKRGRIHFTDAYCDESDKINEQKRAHVAVDRFSGGAVPGALFFNKVLVGDAVFRLKISLLPHSAQELVWLKKTLLAIHLGVISVGSSKASGLLEIANWDNLKLQMENDIKEFDVRKAEV